MERKLIRYFWGCADSEVIEFAITKARLNKREKEVVTLLLDECMTQEEVAEKLDTSTRNVQNIWFSATDKLLKLPWVVAYANQLKEQV